MTTEFVAATATTVDAPNFSATTVTVTIPMPAAVQTGDICYAIVAWSGSLDAGLTGWTGVFRHEDPSANSKASVYQKTMSAEDLAGPAISYTSTGNGDRSAGFVAYRGEGFDSATEVYVGGVSSSLTVPSSPTLAGTRVALLYANVNTISGGGLWTWTSPASLLTTRASSGSGLHSGVAIADYVMPADGGTSPAMTVAGAATPSNLAVALFRAGRTKMPPARLYPREDGLGTSSASRIYPQPRSQQGGVRQAGGTYY